MAPMENVAGEMLQAFSYHQANRLDEASEIYLRVLKVDPSNSEALHLSGLICAARGKNEEARDRILEAIRISPNVAVYHSNLGILFQTMLDSERARICFGRFIQLTVPPGHTADYFGPTPHRLPLAGATVATAGSEPRELYLNLMKRCLMNLIYQDENIMRKKGREFSAANRHFGSDWPMHAHTMIGGARLDNIRFCVEDVLRRQIQGDLLEAGVWRGGATIFMRAILKAYGATDRNVWVADSFRGVPEVNAAKYPLDAGLNFAACAQLAVSIDQVQENFRRYELLDSQVKFLRGWFRDTLPAAPIEKLALLRLDGDLYESTMDGLVSLYPKLSPGGYLIIDDFVAIPPVRQAVLDYRKTHRIESEIRPIDWSGVFWRRDDGAEEVHNQG